MAEIVLGIATSHAPQLRTPAEKWHLFLEKDQKDRRFDYQALLATAEPKVRTELGEEVFKIKYDACQSALAALRAALVSAAPDDVFIIGDDQHEQFGEDNMPMFSLFYGDSFEQIPRSAQNRSSWWNSAAAYGDQERRSYVCDGDLARHLMQQLIAQGFDIAATNKLKSEMGVGHAFSFVTDHILREQRIAVVPLMVNAFFPPNRPLPARCYDLGKALCRAIREWRTDKRIAIIASGGLSRFIIDEELDRTLLNGVIHKDTKLLSQLPLERLWRLGTGEGLNWITAAGALEQLQPKLLNYVPCYRTPAGTGCAMAFMQWQ